jgi:hypothetical protein
VEANQGDWALRDDIMQLLRIMYRPKAEKLAASLDAGKAVVDAMLATLAAEGLVEHRDGRMPGWVLTEAGTAAHTVALTRWRSSGSVSVVEDAYDEFIRINGQFKQLCTDYQLGCRPDEVRSRLGPLDARVRALVTAASAPCPRMTSYLPRFARATERIEGGDLDALTRPLSDSYHDVWMELHQDLLVTLGRSRTDGDGS